MNILAIPGSLRRDSYNRRLLVNAQQLAPAGMHITLTDALGTVPLFNEELEPDIPASVRALRQAVTDADALLIATAEYNQSIPGVLKNGIDWLSRTSPDEPLVNKPVAIIGATPGRWGTRLAQSHLRHVLYATECLVMPQPSVFVAGAAKVFDGNGMLVDTAVARQLMKTLAAFAQWVERVKA